MIPDLAALAALDRPRTPLRRATPRRAALLALVAVLGGAMPCIAAAQSSQTVTADALLLGGTNRSISVGVSDVTVSRVQTTAFGIEAFNADTGVLTGVSAGFSVAPGTALAGRADHGATFVSGVGASWTLAGIGQGGGPLNAVGANNPDALAVGSSTSWAQLAAPGLPLDRYVGSTPLSASVTTTLDLTRTDGKGNDKTANAYIVSATDPTRITDLHGQATLTYSYLGHANASFSAGVDQDGHTLTLGATGTSDFSIFALGSAAGTTRLGYDMLTSIRCDPSTACSDYALDFDAASGLLGAGQSFAGTIVRLGSGTGRSAIYTFTLFDDPTVGAETSRRSTVLSLTVQGGASVVPEPHSAALLLAGLLAIGAVRRQRLLAHRQQG